jgi:putative FmdB family regulatory protein
MPTYEYVCEKCGHQFEVFHSMVDKPLEICPRTACAKRKWGRGRVKKVIGAGAGLLFKGSGFYITDYRSDKYREAAKKESGSKDAGAGSNGSGAAGSEAKPDKTAGPATSKSEGKAGLAEKKI